MAKTQVKLTKEQEENLKRILREVWNAIQYDIAEVMEREGEDFYDQKAVEVAECCVDDVGMHGGKREDKDTLCQMDKMKFNKMAKEVFKEFK